MIDSKCVRASAMLAVCLNMWGCGGGSSNTSEPPETPNQRPVAYAGTDQSAQVGANVQLSGLQSSDPDGDPLSYQWSLTKPSASQAALNGAASSQPSFIPDIDGTYQLSLVVSDGELQSLADQVVITVTDPVSNGVPSANGGDNRTVNVGEAVQLDGSGSSDPDNDPLNYAWQLLSQPPGSNASLFNTRAQAPTITPDVAGSYQIQLVVDDGELDSAAVQIVITAVEYTSLNYAIVDTAQSDCYDAASGNQQSCAGIGHDADYRGNQPSYTLSQDGTVVTDNVTGLVWTQSTDLNNDQSIDVNDKRSQSEAISYCSNLTLNGRSDWRLPSIKEAYSLIAFSGKDPSGYSGTDIAGLTPFIDAVFDVGFGDQSAGERIIDGQYATSTNYVSTTMNGDATMFGMNFIDGRIKGYPLQNPRTSQDNSYYVRCVAGNDSYGENQFVDNGDRTISDQATGLMWQQDDYESSNWSDGVGYCESATTAGYSDWRLPNVKELHSLVDYSRSPETHNSAAIDPTFQTTSFTNEGGETDWGAYWSSTTHVSHRDDVTEANGSNAAYINFGRSLGYMNGNMLDVHGAGAQRSDDKTSVASGGGVSSADLGYGTFYYKGPQSDILRDNNMVRCVRDDEQAVGAAIPTNGSVNILLIVGDDIGVDNISGYGEHPGYSAQTPNIDQLAESGVLFRNVWANPMCSPSRASLLTGRHAIHHGVFSPGEFGAMPASEYTIAEALKASGYQTALFGKWHLGKGINVLPTSQGFDYYSGSLENIDDYYGWEKTVIAAPNSARPDPMIETGYATEVITQEAADWITKATGPWFVEVAYNAPHAPFHVPPKAKFSNITLAGSEGESCTRSSANDAIADCYRAAAEAMDTYIGELLAGLGAQTRANTLVIFLGDNGTTGEAVVDDTGYPFASNHAKGTVYEGGVNVPLVISAPSSLGLDPGEVDALIQIQDLFPTLLSIGNATTSSQVDGKSLLGHLDAEATPADLHSWLYSELYDGDVKDRWAITNGFAKYINNEGVEECYDLELDAAETMNQMESSGEIAVTCESLKIQRPQ